MGKRRRRRKIGRNLLSARRYQDNWHIGGFPYFPANRIAVHFRHHHIKKDNRRRILPEKPQRLLAIRSEQRLIALLLGVF